MRSEKWLLSWESDAPRPAVGCPAAAEQAEGRSLLLLGKGQAWEAIPHPRGTTMVFWFPALALFGAFFCICQHLQVSPRTGSLSGRAEWRRCHSYLPVVLQAPLWEFGRRKVLRKLWPASSKSMSLSSPCKDKVLSAKMDDLGHVISTLWALVPFSGKWGQ